MIRKSVVMLGSMVVFLPSIAYAQSASGSPEPTSSSDIVVTATRSGSTLKELPISVSVIDLDTIEGQIRQNRNILTGLEFTVPGLNVQSSEDRGSCSGAIRGRSASFQINGVPVNEDLRPGSCTGPFTISPFAIDRIEVVRGGTALYGSGAPGGIINLITRRATSDRLEIDATLQTSFNTVRSRDSFTTDIYAGAGQRVGAFDYYIGTSYTDAGRARSGSGQPVPSTAFEAVDLLGSFGLDLGNGQELRFTGTFHDEQVGQSFATDFGVVDPATGLTRVVEPAPNPALDEARDRNVTAALSYHHLDLIGHDVSISIFYQDQSIRQRDNFFSTDFGDDFFASDRENSRLGFRSALVRSYDIGTARLKTSYGFDFTRNDFLRFIVDPGAGGAVTGYITPSIYLNTYAPFAQLELGVGGTTITGGVRHEWYRGAVRREGFDPALPRAATPGPFGKSSLTLWNVGAVVPLTDGIQLYGGFSQGAELTEIGRAARGATDPGLISPEPAPSNQFEIGVRGQAGSVDFGLAFYHSRSESSSQIQPDPSCAGQGFCPLIPFRVPERFRGVEANTNWRATDSLTLSAVFTLQRGKIFNEDLGRYIAYGTDVAVPLRITGRAEWRPTAALALNAQVTHYGPSSYFTDVDEGLGFVDTAAVTLASAGIRYTLGRVDFYLSADNLLNESYVSVASQNQGPGGFSYVEAPGRRVTIGVSGRF